MIVAYLGNCICFVVPVNNILLNLYRTVIIPTGILSGRQRSDEDLSRMLPGVIFVVERLYLAWHISNQTKIKYSS